MINIEWIQVLSIYFKFKIKNFKIPDLPNILLVYYFYVNLGNNYIKFNYVNKSYYLYYLIILINKWPNFSQIYKFITDNLIINSKNLMKLILFFA